MISEARSVRSEHKDQSENRSIPRPGKISVKTSSLECTPLCSQPVCEKFGTDLEKFRPYLLSHEVFQSGHVCTNPYVYKFTCLRWSFAHLLTMHSKQSKMVPGFKIPLILQDLRRILQEPFARACKKLTRYLPRQLTRYVAKTSCQDTFQDSFQDSC